MKKLFYLFFISFVFISCKKNKDTVDLHYDYYPLEKGTFVEYEVTHMTYNINVDTIKYRLKTVVGDTVIDNEGRIARKFYRYIYSNIYNEWKIKDLWTTIIDQHRAELVEENQRVIKMVFAPTKEKEWDINAFNVFKPFQAYYEDIHEPYSINGKSFDKTVKVVQEYSEPNLVEFKNKYEIYAKGVGMVEKTFIELKYVFSTGIPSSGEQLFYKLVDYGKE
jgi:hypothetical protein